MASSTKFGRRMDEFVRELAEEFGELPESDEPLITQIEDWAIEIGDAGQGDGAKVGIAGAGWRRAVLPDLWASRAIQRQPSSARADPARRGPVGGGRVLLFGLSEVFFSRCAKRWALSRIAG